MGAQQQTMLPKILNSFFMKPRLQSPTHVPTSSVVEKPLRQTGGWIGTVDIILSIEDIDEKDWEVEGGLGVPDKSKMGKESPPQFTSVMMPTRKENYVKESMLNIILYFTQNRDW